MVDMGRVLGAVVLAGVLGLSACSAESPRAAEQTQPAAQLVRAAPGREQVVWLDHPSATAPVKLFFAYEPNVEQRRRPFTRPAAREVHTEDAGITALQLLFEGPRSAEVQKGLRFESSAATGISDVAVSGGIARVYLTGGCDAQGSVVTVADEITDTLKQFPVVKFVKVYGPDGTTQQPEGPTDSIPACLSTTRAS